VKHHKNSNNVVAFGRPSRPVATIGRSDPNAGQLTAALIMESHRRGELEPAKTLVIEPNNARTIVTRMTQGDLTNFVCTDKGNGADNYAVTPDDAGNFVVSRKGGADRRTTP
jgi:hypothetical protein